MAEPISAAPQHPAPHPGIKFSAWGDFLIVVFLACYAYALMEWLFIITKPSFMDTLLWQEKFEILLITSALLAGSSFLAALPLMLVSALPRFRRHQDKIIRFAGLLPAAVLAALGLLWIDNFSYSLFKFGIINAKGGLRAIYALLFVGLLAVSFRWVDRLLGKMTKTTRQARYRKMALAAFGLILVFSLGPLFLRGASINPQEKKASAANNKVSARLPHILLITGDGINAGRMSVYGYERDTTPSIRKLADTALVAENAFTNSGQSSGSVISMYTGKSPAQTRVIYPPDILKGSDAYQHLPGILQSLGYRTVQITAPYYMDAYTFNLQDGFDSANGRSILHRSLFPIIGDYLSNNTAYFLSEVVNRIYDRLRHIFFIKEMENPYELVTDPDDIGDNHRMDQLYAEIRSANQPLFIHVHLLGTHGAYFAPAKRVYSDEKNSQREWDQDAYDDSILEFDAHVGTLVNLLEKKHLLDKTILIIGSDHGQNHEDNVRIPLLIRFPKGQFAGKLAGNIQNLDIAPTLLDYLGIEQPAWMQGQSLLPGQTAAASWAAAQPLQAQPISAQRSIFSFCVRYAEQDENGNYAVNTEKAIPPFYQFGTITLISCQRWFLLGLTDLKLWYGEVDQYTTSCAEGDLLSPEQAINLLKGQLQISGFDISSLSNIAIQEK